MRTGPGSDRGFACETTEALAVGYWVGKATDVSEIIGQVLLGPAMGPIFFVQLTHCGLTLAQYHVEWQARSGVPVGGLGARIHRTLTEILRLVISVYQADPAQLVSAECVIRELLRVEAAVNRNLRQPDFYGLEMMMSSCLNANGSLDTPAFGAWVAITVKQATMMKQPRLLREERNADAQMGQGDTMQPRNDKGRERDVQE